jgi:PAS domain S-box-containing protein
VKPTERDPVSGVFSGWALVTVVAKSQALVKLLVLAALSVCFVAGGAYWRTERAHLRRAAEVQLGSIAAMKADQIAAWRREQLDDLAEIAGSPLLGEAVGQLLAGRDRAKVAELLRARLALLVATHHYTEVALTDVAGRVVLSATGAEGPLDAVTTQAVADALAAGRPVLTDLHADAADVHPRLAAVAPIGPNVAVPTTLGCLVEVSDTQRFLDPLVDSWPVPSATAESVLVRRDGDQVVFLNNLRRSGQKALRFRLPLTRKDLPAVMAVQGRQGLVAGVDYSGHYVLAALRAVPDSPWFLVAKVDEAEAFASQRLTTGLILLLLGSTLAVVLASGLLLWQTRRKSYWKELYRLEAERRAAEARHRVTLQSIGDGVIATDTAGRVELINAAAAALTGWTPDEARGRPVQEVFDIINEHTRAVVENPVQRVLRDGVVVNLANHTLLIAKDGSERPIADCGSPINGDDGAALGAVLVFRDQSDERAAELALRRERDNLRAVMTASPVGLLVINASTEVVQANAAAEGLLGRRLEELEDRRCGVLLGCANRLLDPKGCGLGPACGDCPLRTALTSVFATGQPVHEVEMAGEFERDGGSRDAWLRLDVEPVELDGQPHCIVAIDDVTADRHAEQALRDSARTLAEAQRLGRLGGYAFDIVKDRWTATEVLAEIFGIDPAAEQTFATWLELIHPDDRAMMLSHWQNEVIGQRRDFDREYRIHRVADGAMRWVHGRGVVRYDDQGRPLELVGMIQDITERHAETEAREALQVQLAQAQKMESIGRLAGGVAHDFNNILGVIAGHAELLLADLDPNDPRREDVVDIGEAARRSAELTRQLLAFARRQPVAPRPLDLNATVEAALKMLRRVLGEEIELVWRPDPAIGIVRLDSSQVDQILVNLCVNAKDAIDGVGRVELSSAAIAAEEAAAAGLPREPHVLLSVRDDGRGMDGEVAAQVFEPFFTTKPLGLGTGLGLSTVYGIVQQNNGVIQVESAPGAGANFRLYWPCLPDAGAAAEPAAAATAPHGRGQTVLVVEDEPAILRMASKMLARLGYHALTASTAADAQALTETHPEIELLLVDVVMPGMNGRDLADRLRTIRPDLRCLFMSGYTADVITHRGVLDEGVQFVAKPFALSDLAAKIHAALQAIE